MNDYVMPALGADMDKGEIVAWHVKPGDQVHRGDVVADVETDKGTIEIEIWQSGTVSEILVEKGRKVNVGTPIARILSDFDEKTSPKVNQQLEPKPQSKVTEPPTQPPASSWSPLPRRVSPLARRIAAERHIDLSKIKGTGEDGAITRADVEGVSAPLLPAEDQMRSSPDFTPEKVDKTLAMRRAIGLAMAKSKREIPHYYLQTDIVIDKANKWLTDRNLSHPVTERLLPVSLILKAIALAAKKFPEINGRIIDGNFHPDQHVDLGVAISLRGGGLVAPAIQNADQKSLPELMENLMDLVQRARAGKLRGSEVTNQTLTVTNLGDTGVDAVYGVIHPPQVAMIGVGRSVEKVLPSHGLIGIFTVQTVTLAADHRASDGHRGALFLAEISKLLQEPELL